MYNIFHNVTDYDGLKTKQHRHISKRNLSPLKMRNVVDSVRFLDFLQHRPLSRIPSVQVSSQTFKSVTKRSNRSQAFKSVPERYGQLPRGSKLHSASRRKGGRKKFTIYFNFTPFRWAHGAMNPKAYFSELPQGRVHWITWPYLFCGIIKKESHGLIMIRVTRR